MSSPRYNHREVIYVPGGEPDGPRFGIVLLISLALVAVSIALWMFWGGDNNPQNQPNAGPTSISATQAATPNSGVDETPQPSTKPSPAISPSASAALAKDAEKIELGDLVFVASVTDGDTIRVEYRGSNVPVRFIGVDTPEVANYGRPGECFGQESSKFTARSLQGKRVYLVRDGMQADRDTYGRLLRFVFLEDKTNFNELLVRKGFATFEGQYPIAPGFRQDLIEAEEVAVQKNKGIWKACS